MDKILYHDLWTLSYLLPHKIFLLLSSFTKKQYRNCCNGQNTRDSAFSKLILSRLKLQLLSVDRNSIFYTNLLYTGSGGFSLQLWNCSKHLEAYGTQAWGGVLFGGRVSDMLTACRYKKGRHMRPCLVVFDLNYFSNGFSFPACSVASAPFWV